MEIKTKKLPIIYSRNANGGIQQWEIIIHKDGHGKGNSFYTREGLVNGKLIESKPTIVIGKNINRSNQTTNEEQTYLEAKRKWDKKIEKGYHENIDDIDDEGKFFEPMLAKKYLDFKNELKVPFVIQRKYNGSRMIATKKGLFTRNGKKYISCLHIQEILKPLFLKFPNYILDGEIYTHDYPFEKIMSLVRKIKPTKEDLEESKRLVQFHIYDGVVNDKNLGYIERYEIIKKEIEKAIGKNKSIAFAEYLILDNEKQIDIYHDQFVREGYEGAMIRILNVSYENKRSKNLLKYKKFFDDEFEIIDIIEGIGNRQNMAGSLLLKTKEGKQFNSGIKGGEDYYKELMKNKSKLIGKYATVRYQNLSDKEKIPIFPVCVDVDRGDV